MPSIGALTSLNNLEPKPYLKLDSWGDAVKNLGDGGDIGIDQINLNTDSTVSHKYPSAKDRAYFEANGQYAEPTFMAFG